MYDGIARDVTESLEQPPLKNPPRAGTSRPDEPDDAEDWEEFEVGQKPPDDASTPAPASPTLPSPADFHISKATLTTLLETLFDSTEPATPADLPNSLDPLDSFTTTERRAWYRLSRQGSARLYDAGDPDNYARAAWAGSAISAETFGIVRRWMQEGSTRTRVGGVREAVRFGWEASSSSDPVDLSFLKRRSTGGRTGRTGGSASVSVPKQPGGAGAPVDAGGAQPLSVPPPRKGPSAAPPEGGGDSRPLSVPYPPRGPTVAPEPRSKPAKPSPLVFAQKEESDEEWGEMVSSPQATASFDTASGTATDSRADSAISFGKSGSGSSLDNGPVGPKTPRSIPGHGGKPQGGDVRILSPALGHSHATETLPARPQAVAARAGAQMQTGAAEAVGGVIARLPDLSYMLR